MTDICEFDVVRVVALREPATQHLRVDSAERPPRLGDEGTVVDLQPRGATPATATRYLVEATRGDATCIWLAEFARGEIELIPARPDRAGLAG